MSKPDQPSQIADQLIQEHGLKKAMNVVMLRVAETYGAGDGYRLSVLREVKYILAERSKEARPRSRLASDQGRREPPYRPTLDDPSASGSKRPATSAVTFVLLAMLLAGCFHHPLGMSEAQWLALTPKQ